MICLIRFNSLTADKTEICPSSNDCADLAKVNIDLEKHTNECYKISSKFTLENRSIYLSELHIIIKYLVILISQCREQTNIHV